MWLCTRLSERLMSDVSPRIFLTKPLLSSTAAGMIANRIAASFQSMLARIQSAPQSWNAVTRADGIDRHIILLTDATSSSIRFITSPVCRKFLPVQRLSMIWEKILCFRLLRSPISFLALIFTRKFDNRSWSTMQPAMTPANTGPEPFPAPVAMSIKALLDQMNANVAQTLTQPAKASSNIARRHPLADFHSQIMLSFILICRISSRFSTTVSSMVLQPSRFSP